MGYLAIAAIIVPFLTIGYVKNRAYRKERTKEENSVQELQLETVVEK